MARNDRPDIPSKLTSLSDTVGKAFLFIGVFGVLLVAAVELVYPTLVGMKGLAAELWSGGPLGKTCLFAVIGFTGLLSIKFAEWYKAYVIAARDD